MNARRIVAPDKRLRGKPRAATVMSPHTTNIRGAFARFARFARAIDPTRNDGTGRQAGTWGEAEKAPTPAAMARFRGEEGGRAPQRGPKRGRGHAATPPTLSIERDIYKNHRASTAGRTSRMAHTEGGGPGGARPTTRDGKQPDRHTEGSAKRRGDTHAHSAERKNKHFTPHQ